MEKPKIMIVEDDAVSAMSITKILEKAGYSVSSQAVSGEEAILKAETEKPDVILMDILLEGKMDGIETAQEINLKSNVPIIYLTGSDRHEIVERAAETDLSGYLIKPISERELLVTLEIALHKKKYFDKAEKAEIKLKYRIEIEKMITSLSTIFLNLDFEEFDEAINHALRTIGEFCRVDRSYILILDEHEGKTKLENSYEWCARGVEPHLNRRQELSLFSLLSEEDKNIAKSEIESLKGMELDNFPWVREQISNFEIIYIHSLNDLPPEAENEKKEFSRAGIKSLINVPMMYGGRLIGYLGFDSVRQEKSWSDEDIRLLKMIGHILVNTIERKKADEARERFRSIIDQAGEAIFIIDPEDGRFLDVSKTTETQLGYSREELLSMKMQDIETSIMLNTSELWKEHVKQIKASDKFILTQGTHRHKNGSIINVELSISYKSFTGKDYILAVARDVTERERVKKLVESQQKQLIQADKMISIGTMAAGVAHEINNPLSVAVGDIHLLERDFSDILSLVDHISKLALPQDAQKGIEKLKKDIDLPYIEENFQKKVSRCGDAMARIRDIVQNLKDFSHLDKGEIISIDINKNIESTLKLVPKNFKQDIEIKTEFAALPNIPCLGRQINQVFMNIIVNALHAMKGGGTLKIKTSLDDHFAYIKFIDVGHGIPEDTLKKIFDPFFTTKPVGQGTGLGLSISYSIMEKHGGNITVENNPDKGTTFTVKLLKNGVKG